MVAEELRRREMEKRQEWAESVEELEQAEDNRALDGVEALPLGDHNFGKVCLEGVEGCQQSVPEVCA